MLRTPMYLIVLLAILSTAVNAAEENAETEMAAMMARMQKLTAPGEAHSWMQRLLGKWQTKTRITMAGAGGEATAGEAVFEWLMPGRWMQQKANTTMMGMPITSVSILGYDNFKKSYVATSVTSMDTAMNSAEGDVTPDGNTLILYGTVDEYLTGEHDKMVKTVYRFDGEDRFTMEIHDLPIGETNTKVVEVVYTRQSKQSD